MGGHECWIAERFVKSAEQVQERVRVGVLQRARTVWFVSKLAGHEFRDWRLVDPGIRECYRECAKRPTAMPRHQRDREAKNRRRRTGTRQ